MKNKTLRFVTVILAGLFLTLLALFTGQASRAQGGTFYCVNQSGTGCAAVCNGGCFNAVQAAVNAAQPGAEIRIAEGTYTSAAKHVAAITKELRLVGGFNATCAEHDPDVHRTVLDAQRRGSVISATWPAGDVVLEFLTIINGNGDGNCNSMGGCGGGIYAESVNLHVGNCVISNNVGNISPAGATGEGGGIYAHGDIFELWDSRIVSNTAALSATTYYAYGGGVFARNDFLGSVLTMTRNFIANNVGSSANNIPAEGGGVFLYAPQSAIVISNTIENNIAATKIGGSGGGIAAFAANVTIAANRINGNNATTAPNMPGYGGGLYLTGDSAINITRNVISGNVASPAMPSGGVLNESWGVITLSNNLIVNNTANPESGGGVFVYNNNLKGYSSKTLLFNNTIAGNGSNGIVALRSSLTNALTLTLNNNLIVNHTTGITAYYSSTIIADTNLFHNTADPITGANAILADPRLSPDYHLYNDSPAVDAGLTIPWLTIDLAGATRPQGGGYDIGAYEEAPPPQHKIYLPLVLKN
jgi:hypothetical protein